MAAANKLLVVHADQRIGGGEEFGMEDHFDTIVAIVEQLTASQVRQDGIDVIIDDVVRTDGWQAGSLGCIYAALQADDIIRSQKVISCRHFATG